VSITLSLALFLNWLRRVSDARRHDAADALVRGVGLASHQIVPSLLDVAGVVLGERLRGRHGEREWASGRWAIGVRTESDADSKSERRAEAYGLR